MNSDAAQHTIGERIAAIRTAKGLSQADLARAAGLTRSAISQVESGMTKSPSAENVFRIADALGVDARELTFGPGGKPASIEHQIADLLQMLPDDIKQEPLDFTMYKIEKSEGLIASEQMGRYLTMIGKIRDDMAKKRGK